ncbi:AAA family ATPase [Aerolutibacter ruishenii]|uniref:Adenylate kinase family enzyme n=1 Tax=Aerolutibacter ruishenii TaxID=686800 RepID=A0A562LRW7_9GAMM|nr:AAA family ATPase [Lysobacter ruishenii]TWI10394.1 adenylate kinase family enzyme [Lysobacter ruishenii]
MQRIVIIGNSGSGKSTLAKSLAHRHGLARLDLDTIAWRPTTPPSRRALVESEAAIADFHAEQPCWVIEGCYADLVELALPHATQLLFLNPGVDVCIAHCRTRQWEPHKYSSPAAQDRNLAMLLDWVRGYETRDDEFSLRRHRMLFDGFSGEKREYIEPPALA